MQLLLAPLMSGFFAFALAGAVASTTSFPAHAAKNKTAQIDLSYSFPDVPGLGFLEMRRVFVGNANSGLARFDGANSRLATARGKFKVRVPVGSQIIFVPGPKLVYNPDFMRQIDAANIKVIKLTVNSVTLEDSEIGNDFVLNLKFLPNVEELCLGACDISSKGLSRIKELPNLRILNLHSTLIGSRALPYLGESRKLTNLDISTLALGDADLAPLATLPELRVLSLANARLKDGQLAALAKSRSIKTLYLNNNLNLTDKSAADLAKFKGLEKLFINSTRLTAAGLVKLGKIPEVIVSPEMVSGIKSGELARRFPHVRVLANAPHGVLSKDEMKLFAPMRY